MQVRKIIGAVGGIKIPPVDVWIAGYKACAQRANKGIKVLIGYSQDFVDSTKCRRSRRTSSPRARRPSSRSPTSVASARSRPPTRRTSGGSASTSISTALAGNILTSGIKRVDEGVFQFIKAVKTGALLGTGNLTFDLANNGVGYGKVSPQVPKAIIASTDALKQRIIDGKYTPPPLENQVTEPHIDRQGRRERAPCISPVSARAIELGPVEQAARFSRCVGS